MTKHWWILIGAGLLAALVLGVRAFARWAARAQARAVLGDSFDKREG